jgi:hypothetical protein
MSFRMHTSLHHVFVYILGEETTIPAIRTRAGELDE